MKAVILAAGRGSRMGLLSKNQPKCMTRLHGKMLIEWQYAALHCSGINDVAIVKGYCGYKFNLNTHYFENRRWYETNMVISLLAAQKWLCSDICIVSYSDIVYSKETVKALSATDGDILITYDKNWLKLWQERFDNPLSDAETFQIDKNGVLLSIGGIASSVEEIQGQYMGLIKFTPAGWRKISDFLESLPTNQRDRLDITTLLSLLIKAGVNIKAIPNKGAWCEIDTQKDLMIATKIIPHDSMPHIKRIS